MRWKNGVNTSVRVVGIALMICLGACLRSGILMSKSFKEGSLMPHSAFTLMSSSFEPNSYVPRVHAHTGSGPGALNKSPSLLWSNPPAGTESFALICNDPDAVGGNFIHWVMYNIPAHVHALPEGIEKEASPASVAGAQQGRNSYNQIGFDGPNPPVATGVHRYTFTLYALDTHLTLKPISTTASDLEEAMHGHVLGTARLIGLFAAPH